MNIERELVETCIEVLNKAFNAEGDVFGRLHNTAVDTVSALERLLEEDIPEELNTDPNGAKNEHA